MILHKTGGRYSPGTSKQEEADSFAAQQKRRVGPAKSVPPAKPLYHIGKRATDIVLSFCLLLVFAPLFLLIALFIAADSKGAILHRRRVLARQSVTPEEAEDWDALQTFDAFKFRTMRPDADGWLLSQPDLYRRYCENYKLDDDPRVTRIGRILRRTSLDELPQLLNVLMGQMTLVGPRMITPPELARYESEATRLLAVTPGLTGLWQVTGRSKVSYAERVRLDMTYIENRSLLLDAEILLRTAQCVFSGDGAR